MKMEGITYGACLLGRQLLETDIKSFLLDINLRNHFIVNYKY